MKKERLDKFLVDQGFFDSREKAKKAIMAGLVVIKEQTKTKAGEQIALETPLEDITVKGNAIPFVSRGGLKLDKGLKVFDFPVKGLTFMDIGASTGGFTDCLLQNGATKVTAIDVGYGQFDWRLRNDDRVICRERTNFRLLKKDENEPSVDGTVMDVSFISITKLLEPMRLFLKEGGLGIWLIKPQFEAGREKVGKRGVIKDPKVHREVLENVLFAIQQAQFKIRGLDYSPIKGPKGNVEFLCFVEKLPEGQTDQSDWTEHIKALVAKVHQVKKEKEI